MRRLESKIHRFSLPKLSHPKYFRLPQSSSRGFILLPHLKIKGQIQRNDQRPKYLP
jgi:hypothetical protein